MLIEYDDFNDFCMRFLIFRGVNIVSVILLENVDGNSFTIFPMNLDLYGWIYICRHHTQPHTELIVMDLSVGSIILGL